MTALPESDVHRGFAGNSLPSVYSISPVEMMESQQSGTSDSAQKSPNMEDREPLRSVADVCNWTAQASVVPSDGQLKDLIHLSVL